MLRLQRGTCVSLACWDNGVLLSYSTVLRRAAAWALENWAWMQCPWGQQLGHGARFARYHEQIWKFQSRSESPGASLLQPHSLTPAWGSGSPITRATVSNHRVPWRWVWTSPAWHPRLNLCPFSPWPHLIKFSFWECPIALAWSPHPWPSPLCVPPHFRETLTVPVHQTNMQRPSELWCKSRSGKVHSTAGARDKGKETPVSHSPAPCIQHPIVL